MKFSKKTTRDLRKTMLGAASAGVSRVVNAGLGLILSVIIVRSVSQETYAAYKQVGALMLIVAVFSSLSLGQVWARYVPEYVVHKRWSALKQFLLGCTAARLLLLALLLLLMGTVFKTMLFSFFNFSDLVWDWYPVIAVMISFSLIYSLIGRTLCIAFLQQHIVSLMDVVESALVLSCILGMALTAYVDFSVIVLSLFLARGTVFVVYLWLFVRRMAYIRRKSSQDPQEGLLKEDYRRIFKFGSVRTFSQQLNFLKNVNVDILAVSHYLPLVDVSLYGIGQVVAGFFSRFAPANILSPVITPLVLRQYYDGEGRNVLDYSFKLMHKVNVFLLLPFLTGVLLFMDKIIVFVFKPEYLPALHVIWVLSTLFFIRAFFYPYEMLVRILEKNWIPLSLSFLSFYNLAMYIVLIPRYGIMGAAVATGSAGALTFIMYWVIFSFKEKIRPGFPWGAFSKIAINTSCMAVVLLLARPFVHSLLGVLFWIACAGIAYVAMSYWNKAFSDRDRSILNESIGRKLWVF